MRPNAAITGVGAYTPEYVLNNEELSTMVDTSDEWIMGRIGIKERRILKGDNQGTSTMAIKAVKQLLEKTGNQPEDIDVLICATVTPDHTFPNTASIITHGVGLSPIVAFDVNAACAGFLHALHIGEQFIVNNRYKKVIVVGADKMSSIVDYTDRTTCPIFGDAAAAVLLEPCNEEVGIIDTILRTNGLGKKHLHMKSGGSVSPATHKTVENKEHYIYQEGNHVFKHAVSNMADVAVEIMERNHLSHEDIAWLVPHQANLRIIDATGSRMGLSRDKVMINIHKYGNTTAATIPLCLWEWEDKLKKGDNIVLAAFGAGFTYGSIYLKWAY